MSLQVELFVSPGCARCGQARATLRALAEEIGGGRIEWCETDVVSALDRAVELGVLATPSLAIDGELLFTGLPAPRQLRAEFERRLAMHPNGRPR